MTEGLLDRTKKVLSKHLMQELSETTFCIVGCGAVGATFAEMLGRTGAKNFILIDGEKVEKSNLNRVPSFLLNDVDKNKVDVLEERLKNINPRVTIQKKSCHLKELDPDSTVQTKETRDMIANLKDVDKKLVINVPDKNSARKRCEKLCLEFSIKTMSIGVHIYEKFSEYECAWNSRLPDKELEDIGYGDGSYMAIMMESTSVGFMMLLHHLENPNSNNFKYCYKKYENYLPVCSQ